MNKKAIKVDLSIFFDDERKMSYILVDPNWKYVACLQKRVQLLFDIESVRFITDGCFLPPQESIEIIKFCNDLKAFVPKESLEKRKKKSKKSKTMDIPEKCENEEMIYAGSDNQKQTKRKSDCLIPEKDLLHIPKRSKASKKELSVENLKPTEDELPQDLHIDNEDEFNGTLSKNSKACISKVFGDYKKFEEENQYVKCQINEINFASTPKEKKRSEFGDEKLEKTSQFLVNKEIATENTTDIAPSTVLHESKLLEQRDKLNDSCKPKNAKNPFTNFKSNSGHIYFDECGEVASSTINLKSNSSSKKGKDTRSYIIFRCPLSDVTNGTVTQKPRVFHLKSKSIASSRISKQVVEIQEDIILPPHPTQKSLIELNIAHDQTKKIDDEKQEEIDQSTKGSITLDAVNNIAVEQASARNLAVSLNQEVNFTDKESESSMDLTNIDLSVTELQNKSHAEKNVTGIKDESEIKSEYADGHVTENQNKSQTKQKNDEVSLDPVDCVDLSIEEEDEEVTSIDNSKEKLDSTAEDKSIRSSASDIEEISEIIDLNESEDNSNNKFNNSTERKSSVTNKDATDITVKNILPFSSDLTVLPTMNDVIIFKLPFVNYKTKTNCITNFLAGKVEHVNRRTKVIQIFVIDGISELSNVTNFIAPTMDNSLDGSMNERHLKVKLTDMIEPKLFSKT